MTEEGGKASGTATPANRVGVVIGSTRPGRICPGIARWVMGAAQEGSPLHYEIVDLAEINLPLLDEPLMASLGRYEHEHTRQWSRVVSSYHGFVFVFPQYNWGYPAPLKNAIDFLYAEWGGKPVSYATYGTRGGNKAALQFQGILGGIHMHELSDHLEIRITGEDVDESWQIKDLHSLLDPYRQQIRAIDKEMAEVLQG